jgi:hypothetical protein
VRLVAGAPGRVVANAARCQVGTQGPGEVAGADVVGGDDQRRPAAESLLGVEQRRDQVGTDRRRRAQLGRLAGAERGGEAGKSLVVERDVEQWAQQSGRDARARADRGPGAELI